MTRLGRLRIGREAIAEPLDGNAAPIVAVARRRPRSRRWRSREEASDRERELSFLREVEAEIDVVSPQFSQITKEIRHFAGRYLSSETPQQALIGIVSPKQGEGRTTVALGLAGALAELYDSVVMVEMETEQVSPTLCTELDLSVSVGLRDCIEGRVSLEETLFATAKENFYLLPAGPVSQQFSRLDATVRTRELLQALRQRFAVVIVDLPPALVSEETPALLPEFDAFVLVANAGSTTTDDVQRTLDLCGPVPLRGVLLNQLRLRAPRWLASLVNR